MRLVRKLLCCFFALAVSAVILYADILFSFPSEITMFKNEYHNPSLGAGVFISDIPESVCTWDTQKNVIPLKSGEYEATLKLANALPFKKITIRVTAVQSVCASGELVGLRIHNKGLIVTGTSSIKHNGENISPAEDAGISPGDVILEINGSTLLQGDDVLPLLKQSTTLTLLRNNSIKKLTVNPVRDDTDGNLKLGVWVRDSTAGVGTMTYFDQESGTYGALGHGISDSDTGVLFNVQSGTVEKSSVVSIKKGTAGTPGEICGSFSGSESICGTVTKNCEAGIFGNIAPDFSLYGTSYQIGVMSQVREGEASILSSVEGSVKEYNISILRSMPFGSATKGLMIKITDPALLDKTGGIVQGMSGSPIIQNGKIIGAVTHVLVNDPTRGYGIFIENMLAEAEKIK